MPRSSGSLPNLAALPEQNSPLVLAWSYSDVTRLYNNEVGYFGGIHFTESNMVPHWTGVAAPTASGSNTGGALAAAT